MVKEIGKSYRAYGEPAPTPTQAKKPGNPDNFVPKENLPEALNVPAPGHAKKGPESKPADAGLKAATTIQAAFRGREVRKKTVFASEVAKYLNEHLKEFEASHGGDVNIDAMSKAISREILKYSQDPNSIPDGNGVRLFQQDREYVFPLFDDNNKKSGSESFKLPTDLWIRRASDGRGLELEMIGKELGAGANKTVYQSRPLRIDLKSPTHKKEIDRSVLVRAEPGKLQQVLDGMKAVTQFFTPNELAAGHTSDGKEIRFAGLLTHTDRRDNEGVLEARDVEYAGDLERHGNLSTDENMQVLADVASTLAGLHARGGVHGDVKGGNIMVDGERPRGFLSDFDGVGKIGDGVKEGGATGPFMDAIAKEKAILTPFTDIYGLAKTASKSLFNTFSDDPSEFEQKADERIDRLVTFYELGEDQKRALLRMRDAISGVLTDNKDTLDFLENKEQVMTSLRSDDPEVRKKAIDQLYNQFPSMADFLESMQEAQKAFAQV